MIRTDMISILTWYISGKKKRDTGYGYHVQEECGTIEDCFDNFQPCPRYGVVVKVTYTTGKSNYGSGYGLTERQTGEGFKSAAPPDCRVTLRGVSGFQTLGGQDQVFPGGQDQVFPGGQDQVFPGGEDQVFPSVSYRPF